MAYQVNILRKQRYLMLLFRLLAAAVRWKKMIDGWDSEQG